MTFSRQQVEDARRSLGELPAQLRARLQDELPLSAYDADVLVNQGLDLVRYFLDVAQAVGDGKQAANWVTQDVLRVLKEQEISIAKFSVGSQSLAEVIIKVESGELPGSRAREVFQLMVESEKSAAQVMAELGIEEVDASALEALCEELLAANPKIVEDVRGGKMKAIGALIGQAKKKNPNVSPDQVRETCLRLIKKNA